MSDDPVSIKAGDCFVQISPAPGYEPDGAQVLCPAERDGWWWVRWRFRPGASRAHEATLLNKRIYKPAIGVAGGWRQEAIDTALLSDDDDYGGYRSMWRQAEAEVAGFAVLARERYEMACRFEREAEQARDALRLAHQMVAIAEEWAEEVQHAGYAVPTGKESEFAAFWDRLQEVERELAGVAFEKPLGRDKRQGAIDTALSWMRNSAYVGGPSERDAWRKALEVLGPFGTHHIQMGDGDG